MPRALLAVGLVLLALAVALLTYAVTSRDTVRANQATLLPGGEAHLLLRSDEDYGLSSADLAARCTVTDPSGADVSVAPPSFAPYGDQPEVLRFRTGHGGTYHVVCETSQDVVINLSRDTPGFTRARILFWLSFPLATSGLVLALTGGIWAGVRRSRRHRLLLAGLAARSGSVSPAAAWGASGPVTGPAAGAPVPASSVDASRPGPARPGGGYGIAPHPVVYQPSSPGTGHQVLPGPHGRTEPPAGSAASRPTPPA